MSDTLLTSVKSVDKQ